MEYFLVLCNVFAGPPRQDPTWYLLSQHPTGVLLSQHPTGVGTSIFTSPVTFSELNIYKIEND